MRFSPLTEEAMIRRMNTRCPTCNMVWWLFPPAKIDGEEKVRCVECKDVFDAFMAVDVLDQGRTLSSTDHENKDSFQ